MYLLCGLGNPGSRYALTRHNIGFIFCDLFARSEFSEFKKIKDYQAEVAEAHKWNSKFFLMKPQTFMNLSGQSLRSLYMKKSVYKNYELIVVHDEVDLPFGEIKIKKGGGDAGHNGLKSIRAEIGSGDYYRLRLGVGRPPRGSRMDLADYVLQSFDDSEKAELPDFINASMDVLDILLRDGLQKAQEKASKYNQRLST